MRISESGQRIDGETKAKTPGLLFRARRELELTTAPTKWRSSYGWLACHSVAKRGRHVDFMNFEETREKGVFI